MNIAVKIVIAFPDHARLLEIRVRAGTTVEQAIKESGICAEEAIEGALSGQVGIYGKSVPLHRVLRDGDRIELYRPLMIDPKAIRRKRAQKR